MGAVTDLQSSDVGPPGLIGGGAYRPARDDISVEFEDPSDGYCGMGIICQGDERSYRTTVTSLTLVVYNLAAVALEHLRMRNTSLFDVTSHIDIVLRSLGVVHPEEHRSQKPPPLVAEQSSWGKR